MNRDELTRQVRRHLAEAGTGAHRDDKDIWPELNRAAKNYADENGLFMGTTTLNVVNGSVTVPADLVSLVDVIHTAQNVTLHAVDRRAAADFGPYGFPRAYSFDEAYGRTLNVYPSMTGSVTVTYRRSPPDMTEGTSEAWEGAYEPYHDLIALKAAHQLQGQTGVSAAKDAIWIQRLQQREQEFKNYLARKALDNPPMRLRTGPRRRRYYP